MAADNKTNRQKSTPSESEEGVFSLEDLDQIIANQDPEFNESMSKLGSDPDIKSAELQEFEDKDFTEEEREDLTFKEKVREFFSHLFEAIIDFIYFGALRIGRLGQRLWRRIKKLAGEFKDFMQADFPEKVAKFKKGQAEFRQQSKKWFKELSWAKKSMVILFPAVVAGVVFLAVKSSKGLWLPQFFEPLVAQWTPDGKEFIKYNPNQDMIAFHRMFPEKEHTVLLPKIIANLTASPGKANPMIYLEVYASGNSAETAVELKERERELIHRVRLVVGEFTYDELNTQKGKESLKTAIAQELNRHVSVGMVRRVYIKEVVLKI